MKLVPIAATVAVALLPLSVHAAPRSNEFEENVRQQLEQMSQRLNKLEQENGTLTSANQALAAENAELKSQSEYVKSETRALRKTQAEQANEINKVKGADWATRIQFKGDLRYRFEEIKDDAPVSVAGGGTTQAADRERQRIRARFGFDAKATDKINVGIQLSTTERMGAEDNGDPRSSNQTLGNEFSRKRINLDLAYFDWKFADGAVLTGGKMRLPFVRPGQSVFYDGDVNPEGLAVAYTRGIWFGTGYGFVVNEVNANQNVNSSDTYMAGAQIGARFALGSSTLLAAVQYSDLIAGANRSPAPFYNGVSNGNTTVGPAMAPLLANDFSVIELLGEFNTTLGKLPLQFWVDAAQNQDPDDLDQAYAAGVVLGKAADFRTWEFGTFYEKMEKDALFAQFIDSDFGAGFSDAKGWVFKAGYAPVKNWTLNATYFLNDRNVDVGTQSDYDRLQLDFNVKF